jgi:CBS domain containing-hemolysin-like protein
VVDTIFRPLAWAVRWMMARVSGDAELELVAAEEFKAVAHEDDEAPRLEEEKRELLHSIFEFGGTTAKEVMVPRIDMVMADAETPRRDVLRLIAEHGHSRIPVHDGSVDKIIGAVHVKELVRDGRVDGDEAPIREFVRAVMFVPETKKIDELLREFQEKKTHLAIVVDEYGGTSGMVTLEDVLEEIVGEIEDEYDKGPSPVRAEGPGVWRVLARSSIGQVNESLKIELPEGEDYETIAGLVLDRLKRIPREGETLRLGPITITVIGASDRAIEEVRIRVGKAK